MRFNCFTIIIIISLALCWSCTENSVFDDEIGEKDQRSVSGIITLEDNADPSGVVVWLKELDISTKTDTAGRFSLRLPAPDLQPGAGLNGYVNLFIYVANYRIEHASILMVDGKVQYAEADINEQGDLAQPVHLRKLISIATAISPREILENYSGFLQLTISLHTFGQSVEVQTFKHQRDNTMFTNVFFNRPDGPNEEAIFWRKSSLSRINEIESRDEWHFEIHSDSITLPQGSYEVIPYLIILQDNVPRELIEHFGIISNIYDNSFLNIPIKQTVGHITVKDSLDIM
jgi:hypothetical protein